MAQGQATKVKKKKKSVLKRAAQSLQRAEVNRANRTRVRTMMRRLRTAITAGDPTAAGNYAGGLLAARLAQEKGFHNVLWLDGFERRYIEESGVMNVFFVLDGKAITPPLSGTILPGVTRDSALTLLREMGIHAEERQISIDEVLSAHAAGKLNEAFGAGTAAIVAPIARIRYRERDLQFPAVSDSSVAARLRSRLVAIQTGREPDTYNWLLPV